MSPFTVVFFFTLVFCAVQSTTPKCIGECQRASNSTKMSRVMELKLKEWDACMKAGECPKVLANSGPTPCSSGKAGEYPCENVDLLSFISVETLAPKSKSPEGNDIWGYRDDTTGKEYALVGLTSGTSIVDVTNPTASCVVAFLPTQTYTSLWRDIKVYKDYAFIVSEAPDHGMQILDLKQLRTLDCEQVTELKPTAFYAEFGSAHNIVINEESGYAYSVGSKTCRGGLHIVDIHEPTSPEYAGCFYEDGYVHDAQCVNYEGPDPKFAGKEVCFCYNEDSLTIVDVSDKQAMKMISRKPYSGSQYTHQGWLLPNREYLLLNDELDEIYNSNHHTRTMLWSVKDLSNPVLVNSYYNSETVIDHNLYTLGNRAYLANYCGGLRIYDTSDAAQGGEMKEIAYFDVAPQCNTPEFFGSWSVYPYFPSGTIVVNSIERGLFVLKFNDI